MVIPNMNFQSSDYQQSSAGVDSIGNKESFWNFGNNNTIGASKTDTVIMVAVGVLVIGFGLHFFRKK